MEAHVIGSIAQERIEQIVREEVAAWLKERVVQQTPTVRFTLDDGLDADTFAPNRAHDTDAGADLHTVYDVMVPAHGSAVIHTGVHIELPHNTCGLLVSKSGLNVKSSLTSTGLIDEGYTGEIMVKLYNDSERDYFFYAGEKVSQLVLIQIPYPTYVQADSIDGGERSDSGFGSTGK